MSKHVIAIGGAFDSITHVDRANFFKTTNDMTFIELVIQFRSQLMKNSGINTQLEMFDQDTMSTMTKEPVLSATEKWGRLEKLNKEKTVLGIYISGHPLDGYFLEVKHFCSHQLKDIDLFQNPIKTFSFSGYVHSHIERMGKNNKPYGIVQLEDYSGMRELRLFGQNYIDFRNYFIEEGLLYFSASMIKRAWDGNLSLKINEITLLADVSEKLIREINFHIDVQEVNDLLIESVLDLVKKYPGKHNFKLNISDKDVSVNLLSRKYQVNICSNLINDMSSLSKEYTLK